MAVCHIIAVRNAAQSTAIIRNRESPQDIGPGQGEYAPGESGSLYTAIPWSADGTDFDRHHIEVAVGQGTFTVWQASHDWVDRVRVSTDGAWHNPGDVIGGYAAVGPLETFTLGDDRLLIITDENLWLLPAGLVDPLNAWIAQTAADGFHLCGDHDPRPAVLSVPKLSAVAFSMAGIPSDAFDRREPGARFLYRDSGKRYEFTIANGTVAVSPPLPFPALTQAISYNQQRHGTAIPLPVFDLIAANGGRVFAKEKDTDRFFFAIVDTMFVHGTRERGEFTVPSAYFKLDPEFNQPGARISDLLAHLDGDFARHPAAIRFPLFRFALGLGVGQTMMVNTRRGVWHLIDARPPIRDLRAAEGFVAKLNGLGGSLGPALSSLGQRIIDSWLDPRPAADLPTYDHVQYCSAVGPPSWEPSIAFDRVLDIGVGHVHYHQQYDGMTGGELQMLRAPSDPFFFHDHLQVYQFLNGPVIDPDGFNDGTCNFYILARLTNGTVALLYLDEQSFFSQRWRLADPADFKGNVMTLAADLEFNPGPGGRYDWIKETFWSPFHMPGLIGQRSRLAVSAQVVLVTGDMPDSTTGDPLDGGNPLIYSINFSWGTMDRTWRWRPLPPSARVRRFPDDATGDETIAPASDDTVYPQTIRLRDDMTLHLKGTQAGVVGRWYQRYLPGTNALVPPAGALLAGQRPWPPYSHHWKFLPEPVFQLADRFSHFGIYDQVDSRTQYYPVDTPSDAAVVTLLEQVAASPDEWWADDEGQLTINSYPFRIDTMQIPWPPWPPYPKAPMRPASLYNPEVVLRIVKRGGQWIAMHADKRDDDMALFDDLPKTVALTLRRRDGSMIDQRISVTLQPGIGTEGPPPVLNAYFWWENTATARLAFTTPVPNDPLGTGVYRIRMAAFDGNGAVVPLFDLTIDDGFRFTSAAGAYDHRWTPPPDQAAQLRTYASPQGAALHGTSIWFENRTGHAAAPEELRWEPPPQMRITVDPAPTPLRVPIQLTVHAVDPTTNAPVQGTVTLLTYQGAAWQTLTFPTNTPSGVTLDGHTEDMSDSGGDPRPRGPRRTRYQNPSATITAPGYPDADVPFDFVAPMPVRLRAQDGLYVSAEGGGGGPVVANRRVAAQWETWKLVPRTKRLADGSAVWIQAFDGLYLSAENGGGGALVANRSVPLAWETFIIHAMDGKPIGNGSKISLSTSNGHVICAEGGGGGAVDATRTAAGPWETFTLLLVPGAP